MEVPHIWDGKIELVKIVEMAKGPKKKQALLFYGKVRALELDPNAFFQEMRGTLVVVYYSLGKEHKNEIT